MEGITVTFAVTAGSGSVSAKTVTTGANGRAASTLTLGSESGTNTVEIRAEGVSETVTFSVFAENLVFNLSVPSGISMIHIPLKVVSVDGGVQSIESVADLYDALGGVDSVNWLITYDAESQNWSSYFGASDRGTVGDQTLTDAMGIIADLKVPISVRFGGDAPGTDGMSVITLNRGLNLVGLPLRDPRIAYVSDLFALEGIIGGNVAVIVVTDNGEFRAVGRAGDPGDIAITGGQGFILIVQQPATIPITGTGWGNVP